MTYIDKKMSKSDIAVAFNVKLAFVHATLKVYQKEERSKKGLRVVPGKKVICVGQESVIKKEISNDCELTLTALKEKIIKKFNINISLATIFRYLNKFDFSFKRVSLEPERRNDNKNIKVQATCAQDYLNLLSAYEANIIIIDKVRFNVSMRPLYGRSLIGTKPIHKVK